jgi:hypothetical protein
MTEPISRKFYFGKDIRKGYFASVYNYRPRNENILARKGEIFAVLRLKSNPDFDLVTAGGILLDYFHETYFEIQEESTLLALEKTVISSGKHLGKLIDNDEKVSESGIEMDLIATAIVGNVAYFVRAGESGLMILRDDELVDLSAALKDPSGESLVEIASMELVNGDRLFMSTQGAVKHVDNDKIRAILEKFDIDKFPKSEKENFDHAVMIIGYEIDQDGVTVDPIVLPPTPVEEVEVEPEVEEEIEVEEEELEDEDEKVEAVTEVDELAEDEVKEDVEIDETDNELMESDEAKEEPDAENEKEVEIDQKNKKPKTYMVVFDKVLAKIKSIPSTVKKTKSSNRFEREKSLSVGKFKLPKKILIGIIVILLLLAALLIGIKVAVQNNEKKVQQEETQTSLANLETKVTELENIVAEVKLADSTEKRIQGITLVSESRDEIAKVQDKKDVEEKVNDFKTRVSDAENFLNRIIPVSKDNRLVDVASFFPDSKISDITVTDTKIYLTDSALGKIYSMNPDGTSLAEEISGLKNPSAIAVDMKGKIIFLDESEDNRMAVYDIETKTTKRVAGTSTSKVGAIADIEYAEIAGGRVYLIDTTNKKLMYVEKSGENYGLPASRFELPELSTGKDVFIIDNKIYVLAEFKQGLYRFLNGKDDTPELAGLNPGEDMLKATGMYIDGVNMYFADQANRRIAVFEKGVASSKFEGQYKPEDEKIFTGLQDLVVNTKLQKIFVLDNSEVYVLDLKELNEL